MKKKGWNTLSARRIGVLVASCSPVLAYAQSEDYFIRFDPVNGVPSAGGIMLLILAALLGFFAYRNLRKRVGMGVLPSVLAGALALGALVSAIGGISLMRDSHANSFMSYTIVSPATSIFPVNVMMYNLYVNQSGLRMRVADVRLPPNCHSGGMPAAAGTEEIVPGSFCAAGLILANLLACYINCLEAVPSDTALKTDVTPAGTAWNGLPLYRFRYRDASQFYVGVMAQDVLTHTPEAVHTLPNGYLAVDYAMLGLTMRPVE